ncbi:hypothetical protein [Saccharothrix coeruleofusca]|uniref:Transposase n=1 Tax=Saccharothrix coeruleofusca TaxID=33919 RepID=A0A918ARX1_9PSEU|nr:hypothetical protein [Saccharothrix coeruleofusca]MBP2335796.1 hypothetical protein [Saccharothrix coeruleofusca]GGP75116.1 hypothetical protein GCM10010185_55850 [Saccharothrix coeruleofusca]
MSDTHGDLTDDERAELDWLRAENAFLRVQRDVLMRVASGYALDMEALLRRGAPSSHLPSL